MARHTGTKIRLDKSAKKKSVAQVGTAHAIQASHDDGQHHAVAIWNLSVLIVPDEKFWFAQALEIDYGAQGDTAEEAQENFQAGLMQTINQHIRVYGDIDNMLKFAPSAMLREAARHRASIRPLAHVSFREIVGKETQAKIPFDGIDYRVLQQAA